MKPTYFRAVPILLMVGGTAMFVKGYDAAKNERFVRDEKHKISMTGAYAMFVGVSVFTFGAIWTWKVMCQKNDRAD